MTEFNASALEKNLEDKNFLAAYLILKDSTISRQEVWEYTGKIVTSIIQEMGSSGSKSEKNLYYRSLLLLIFEDVPGLSRIYGRQLRLLEESRASFDILKNLRNLVDAAKDKEELKLQIENTFENIKETIEDTTQNIQDGTTQKHMDDFFYVAGEGIKEGLKAFSSFLSNMSGSSSEEPGENQATDKDTIKQNAEPIDDAADNADGKGEGRKE